jgi:L-fuconolactonase
MPIADAHVHLFADGFSGVYGRLLHDEAAVYEQLRTQFGIDRALVVGYEREARYVGNNAYVLALAHARPWIAPVAYLSAELPPSVESLRELHRQGAIGYSLYLPDSSRARTAVGWPRPVIAELERQEAVISLNATPPAIGSLAPLIDALPGCTFLFSHLGLPGRLPRDPTSEDVRARLRPLLTLAARDNVAVKLSGLYAISDPPHDFPHTNARMVLEVTLSAFGPERVCWGSDFAPALDFVSFGQLADERLLAELSSAEAVAVMGDNLRRLLPPRLDKE